MAAMLMTASLGTTGIHRPGCATREVLDRIADRWATLIIGVLAAGPLRFGEISRTAPDMNPRVLSRTLRGLERDGLIDRHMLAVHPPAVSYSLTRLGGTLEAIIAPLREWAEQNIDSIHQARLTYDETTSKEDRVPWQH